MAASAQPAEGVLHAGWRQSAAPATASHDCRLDPNARRVAGRCQGLAAWVPVSLLMLPQPARRQKPAPLKTVDTIWELQPFSAYTLRERPSARCCHWMTPRQRPTQ